MEPVSDTTWVAQNKYIETITTNTILLYSQVSVFLSHHQKRLLLQQLRTNIDLHPVNMQKVRDLRTLIPNRHFSNTALQGARNSAKVETENMEVPEHTQNTKESWPFRHNKAGAHMNSYNVAVCTGPTQVCIYQFQSVQEKCAQAPICNLEIMSLMNEKLVFFKQSPWSKQNELHGIFGGSLSRDVKSGHFKKYLIQSLCIYYGSSFGFVRDSCVLEHVCVYMHSL